MHGMCSAFFYDEKEIQLQSLWSCKYLLKELRRLAYRVHIMAKKNQCNEFSEGFIHQIVF